MGAGWGGVGVVGMGTGAGTVSSMAQGGRPHLRPVRFPLAASCSYTPVFLGAPFVCRPWRRPAWHAVRGGHAVGPAPACGGPGPGGGRPSGGERQRWPDQTKGDGRRRGPGRVGVVAGGRWRVRGTSIGGLRPPALPLLPLSTPRIAILARLGHPCAGGDGRGHAGGRLVWPGAQPAHRTAPTLGGPCAHHMATAAPSLEAIRWTRGPPARLQLLDQRLLPLTTAYIDVADAGAAWTAIKARLGRWAV